MIFLSTANNLANSTAVRGQRNVLKVFAETGLANYRHLSPSMKHAHPLVSAQVTTVLFVRSRSGEGGINLEHTRRVSPAKCWCRGNVVQRLPTARIPTLRMIRESWGATHQVGGEARSSSGELGEKMETSACGRQSVLKAAEASLMMSFSPPVTKWHLFTCSCVMGRHCGMCVD